jgi:murein DD-endopeptidase MepM/ murein hydrolase activator NlpD
MRDKPTTRRRFLGALALAAGTLVMPAGANAAGRAAERRESPASSPSASSGWLVDPYDGAIPLVFPLAADAYRAPVRNTWHWAREDRIGAPHHRSPFARAHDGVDVFPLPGQPLPVVYAPFQGTVAAVCWRTANSADAPLTYRVSEGTPPPWDFSLIVDRGVPRYGNFVWLRSTEPASQGYLVMLCHLQDEPLLRSLQPDQAVTAATPVGRLGDSGNAAGAPQLHLELHYPTGQSFACRRCLPHKDKLTAINPYPSLVGASPRL